MRLAKSGIIEIVLAVVIIAISFSDASSVLPYYEFFLPLLWIFFMLFDINEARKNLRNKPENEIRISSNNDSYFNILPFILGPILCGVSLLLYFIASMENPLVLVYSILGVVLFIQGLQIIPTVVLSVKEGILDYQQGKIRKSIPIHDLNSFLVTVDEIRFKNHEVEVTVFQHLKLTSAEIKMTNEFLEKYIK